jgi:2,3-bisphosphoglycerate-independent phosphoglycerate mutase
MKFCLVIPDGAADLPLEALGGKTPLEAADIPNMNRIAREGVVGTLRTIPAGYQPGSDVAIMSVLGYDPHKYYTGRAPLEAASMGVKLNDGDCAARCNLVTIADGKMADYSAGHIANEEAAEIMASLNKAFAGKGIEFYPGKSYRNLLILRGAGSLAVTTTPPHDIAGQDVRQYLPSGRDAARFQSLMDAARSIVASHPVNARRRAEGKAPATDIWLWGEGRGAKFPVFSDVYGVRPAVITYVDLVAGICALSSWERIAVPGATGYLDTDYRGKGERGAEALARYDLVFIHVEAPDEASHEFLAAEKVAAIEKIDKLVVGPMLDALSAYGDYRILVLPDHYTLASTGAHHGEPVPFAMCGKGIGPSKAAGFAEKTAAKGLRIEAGDSLMGIFLGKTGQYPI